MVVREHKVKMYDESQGYTGRSCHGNSMQVKEKEKR